MPNAVPAEAHPLEIVRAARVAAGTRLAGLLHQLLRARDLVLDDVADGADLGAFDLQQVADVHRAHAADADESDAHPFHRRRRERRRRSIRIGGQRGPRDRRTETGGDAELEKVAATRFPWIVHTRHAPITLQASCHHSRV